MKLIVPKNPIIVSCPVKELTADKLTALHANYYADVIPYRGEPLPDRPIADLLEEHITMFHARINACGWGGAPTVATPFGFGHLTQVERDKLYDLGVNFFNTHPGLGPILHTGRIVGTTTSIVEVQTVATFLRDFRNHLNTHAVTVNGLFNWATGTDKTVGEYHLDEVAKRFHDQMVVRRAIPYGIKIDAGFRDNAEGIWFGSPQCCVQILWNNEDTFYVRCTLETYQLLKNIATFEQIGDGPLKARNAYCAQLIFRYVVDGELK